MTGSPTAALTYARSGSSRQARFGAKSTVERLESIQPAAPMPTAWMSWPAASSATSSMMTSRVLPTSSAGVSRRACTRTVPVSSTTPPATLVPPTSTPMVSVTAATPLCCATRAHLPSPVVRVVRGQAPSPGASCRPPGTVRPSGAGSSPGAGSPSGTREAAPRDARSTENHARSGCLAPHVVAVRVGGGGGGVLGGGSRTPVRRSNRPSRRRAGNWPGQRPDPRHRWPVVRRIRGSDRATRRCPDTPGRRSIRARRWRNHPRCHRTRRPGRRCDRGHRSRSRRAGPTAPPPGWRRPSARWPAAWRPAAPPLAGPCPDLSHPCWAPLPRRPGRRTRHCAAPDASTRRLSCFNAASMIIFSALRRNMPSIPTASSTSRV